MHHRAVAGDDPRCICMDRECEAGMRRPPRQCRCGWIEFTYFPSSSEATHWSQLLALERRGRISELRRQVPFDLMAYGPGGQPVKVGEYRADFVWLEDGHFVVSDTKPKAGVDDLAGLKLRWMAAMGIPVRILTKGIYV